LIAAAAHGAASGGWPVFAPLRELGAAPLGLLAFAPFMLVFGPLPEELGWRGYALEPLQRGLGPLRAAMLLGVVHALWHLPLFFMEGSYQHSLGVLNISFWRFMANVLVLSIVMTWLFNRTRQSTLAMIIFHFADNLTGELFDLPEPAEWLRMGLYALIAACLVAATRGQLGYRRAIRRYKGARRDRKSWTP
ncbi:MAG: CPBP family intramembrane glutamic endopeptidase, partial [Pseudaminobacter sp.]